jgi:cytochrome c oxidase subunit II
MWSGFPLFPEQASTHAGRVDALYFFLIALTAFFSLLIGFMVIGFALRYKRRSPDDRPPAIYGSLALELTWTLIPLGIVAVIFFWSADVYLSLNRVPKDAIEVHVVGKRWMWKVQHVTGQREINELHVPVGVPVKLTLTSEDVIHSFFIPAFRMKKDALPARYTTAWFQATRPGRYHLFCAEYCGTRHSNMIGWVEVMEPAAFQAWLAGGASGVSLASAGEKLFQDLACVTCHKADSGARGPALDGLFGRPVALADGGTVTADETYIRESIVAPSARVVAGYQPIMPTFQGLVSEEQLIQLVAYVRSLKAKAPPAGPPPAPVAAAPGARP